MRRSGTFQGRWLSALGVVLAMLASARAMDVDAAVARVNGDAITVRELVEAQRRGRAREPKPDALRQAALAACVRAKVIQQLARARGLCPDVSDAALHRAWARENERRATALGRGEVIYGPRQLGWEPFRRSWFDDIERELTRLAAAEADESDEALRRFHRQHAELFTAPGAKAPQPFEELREHVRETRRRENFQRLVSEAVAAADVKTDAALLAKLDPLTPIPAEE
jgi:hypothetical protein